MTWRLADQAAATRHRLRQLGFAAGVLGDDAAMASLKVPARLVLAGTMLVALAVAAFGMAGYRWYALEPPRLIVNDDYRFSEHAAFAAQTIKLIEPIEEGQFKVTLGSARHTVSLTSPAGVEIPVTWAWQPHGNINDLAGNVVLKAGRLAQPIRACSEDWPLRSLVVIAVPFEGKASKGARQLAIRLLDKGSADEVLLGEQWAKALPEWLGESEMLNRHTQVLVILPQGADAEAAASQLQGHPGAWAVGVDDDFAALAREIKRSGSEVIEDVLPQLEVYSQQPTVRLSGGPTVMKPDRNGIEWVRICPGTYTMGTMKKEKDAMTLDDEIVVPPRTVVLSRFEMAATETLQVQDGKKTNLPWVDVDWETARAFCRDAGGDLPTEAQWEYAARGGSRFPWSFGDDEALLGDYANNSRNVDEVRQKLPNPLGLYDMRGNVWEWTRDLYGSYESGVFVNPPVSDSGNCKFVKDARCVVRGGSFLVSPGNLRSAIRGGREPEVRRSFLGFRCVRVPHGF